MTTHFDANTLLTFFTWSVALNASIYMSHKKCHKCLLHKGDTSVKNVMWNGETLETAVDMLELIEFGVGKAEVCRPDNKIHYSIIILLHNLNKEHLNSIKLK
jgi:hypothetical protein